jgi:hypothetical protein
MGQCFIPIGRHTLDMNLPSLHARLQSKVPPMDLQNGLVIIMIFLHTALLLTEEVNVQQMESGNNRFLVTEFSGPTMFHTILKQLV